MKGKEFFTIKIKGEDVSLELKDYGTVSAALGNLQVGEYIHIGYYKPFKNFYIHFALPNEEAAVISYEYFDGTNWVALKPIDETNGFKKSGFIYFERPETWKATTIDGDENFYIRISSNIALSFDTSIKGINVLFSNDQDLISIRSNIVSKLNNGNSWIEKHEEARKHLVQALRNAGYVKVKVDDSNSGLFFNQDEKDSKTFSDLTQFDLLDPFQLREAAKYKAMELIYLNELTDEEDDKYERAGIRYGNKSDELFNLFYLKIDKDDDGVEDEDENDDTTRVNLSWV
jgi:hypothetical protein